MDQTPLPFVLHAWIKRNALPFNNYVRQQFDKHLDENVESYFKAKVTNSERRVRAHHQMSWKRMRKVVSSVE